MATETQDIEQGTMTDESAPPSEAPDEDGTSAARPVRTRLAVVALVIMAAFILFLAFGSVTAYEEPPPGGARETRQMRVLRIWELLHDNLPQVENQELLRVALDIALAVLVVSIAAGLWFALAASQDAGPPSETSDGGA